MDNFEEMGIELPDEECFIEKPIYSKILEGGVAQEWLECPAWMDRSSGEWDPARAKGTSLEVPA